jgi:NAD(P)-dependent dehydrogenase (short-subunit alcohol dehydrogenase family)
MHEGKRVLVTAGAGGIGLSITRAFAAAGAKVHICDIDADALAAVTGGAAITGSACDVADLAAVERWVDEGARRLGGVDVLVNNAGIAGPTQSVEAMAPQDWERVLAVNLTGTFNVTRLAIPHLKRSAAGVVLIMSSLAGKSGYPLRSPYATTKWGLIGLTKTLAMELGDDGIRVNAILPGAVEGPRAQRVLQGRADAGGLSLEQVTQAALANQSLKRFVPPDEIAELALFLASDGARSISGQAISIDNDARV